MKVPKARRLKCGTWFIQLRLAGESIPVTASTERACISKARRIKAEYKDGVRIEQFKDPSPAPEPEPAPTLGQILDAYIDARRVSLSPSTIRGYTIIRDKYFSAFMDRPIQPEREYWQAIYDSGLRDKSPKTMKNAFALIRSACGAAGIQVNVNMAPVPKKERAYLDAEEIPRFCAAVRGAPVEVAALLELHSLRVSEVLGLTWDHVSLKGKGVITVSGAVVRDENNLWVHKDTNKTKDSQRAIPIFIPQLKAALDAVPADQRTGKVIHYETQAGISKAINAACAAAGLPAVGNHGLRHSFASLCYSLGVPDLDCMALGGWSDYQTVKNIYTHRSQKERSESVNNLELFFAGNANKNANSQENP